MSKRLFLEAILKFTLGLIIIFLIIYIPAGSLEYINGWIFMGLLFIPMFVFGIILMVKNPKLLERRLNVKEKEKEQKEVVGLSAIMFIFGFVTAGLNYRFSWTSLPGVAVIIASIVFIISYVLYAEVLRENTYLLRTIEIEKDQKVVDTGMYRFVRHPMYLVTISLFLSIPFILGSILSFIVFLIYPAIIIKRIKNEEKVLERDLEGYAEYMKKVKYRLIPFIW